MTLTVALFLEIAAHCDFLHFLRYTNMHSQDLAMAATLIICLLDV